MVILFIMKKLILQYYRIYGINVIITNMTDIKNLNKWMHQKKIFTMGNENAYLDLLLKLNNDGFNFTREHFDAFMIQVKYLSIGDICSRVCKFMLDKFDPTPLQMNDLCMWGKRAIHDILFDKNWNYTLDNYLNLKNSGYSKTNTFTTFHNSVVFLCCQNITRSYKGIIDNNTKIALKNATIDDLTINILLLYTKSIVNADKHKTFCELFDLIFKNYDSDNIWELMNNKNLRLKEIGILLSYICDKFGYNIDFTKSIIETKIYSIDFLLFSILHGYTIGNTDLNNIIANNKAVIFKYHKKYEKLGLTENLANIDNGYICISKLYDLFKIPITLDTLTLAITHKRYTFANTILENYNVMPTQDTLDLAIKNISQGATVDNEFNVICNILKYKIIPDNDTLNNLNFSCIYDNETMKDRYRYVDLLINNGLILSLEVIEFLLSKGLPVLNLERFGIPYDEKLYFLCYKYDVFCDEYYDKFIIDKSILDLHKLCRSKMNSIVKLTDYLQKNNVAMDKYAIDFLLFNNKKKADAFIEKYKIIPSVITAYKSINKNISLDTILGQHNLTHMHMFEKYDIKIEK